MKQKEVKSKVEKINKQNEIICIENDLSLKLKTEPKGITLIALMITAIVLLILAGVTIATLIGDNGIIKKVITAKEKTNIENIIEMVQIDILGYQSQNNEYITGEQLQVILRKYFDGVSGTETSYVGYYADVDGDGTEDGIIYTDLAKDKNRKMDGK